MSFIDWDAQRFAIRSARGREHDPKDSSVDQRTQQSNSLLEIILIVERRIGD